MKILVERNKYCVGMARQGERAINSMTSILKDIIFKAHNYPEKYNVEAQLHYNNANVITFTTVVLKNEKHAAIIHTFSSLSSEGATFNFQVFQKFF